MVNLYIDRQISPEETAELEADIRANPRHRRVYQQYCKMHRATKLVYESFRAQADEPAVHRPQPGSIARFGRQQRNRWTAYAAAGLAAAACLAFVLGRSGLGAGPAAGPAQPALAGVAPATVTVAAVPAPVPPAPAAQPGFTSLAHERTDFAALLATLRQDDLRSYQSGPTGRDAQLFDDGVFNTKQMLPLGVRQNTPAKKTDKTNAEFIGFQFQR